MKLNNLAKEINNIAKEKGFYDKEVNIGEKLMLIVSELGEAMEADRKGIKSDIKDFNKFLEKNPNYSWGPAFQIYIKDSLEDELSDALIRILDLTAQLNIDIDWHVKNKMRFNKEREKLHGKKY